jgi:hypothetical protein
MPAVVLAAVTAFEMVSRREDRTALLIGVEIKRVWILPDFVMEQVEDFQRIARILSVIGQAFEAAVAEAGRFKFLGDKAQDVGGHGGFVAPAVPFVSLTCCDPTKVWTAANRATVLALASRDLVPLSEWFVQHKRLSSLRLPDRVTQGKPLVRDAGSKKSRSHSRGSEAGRYSTTQEQLVFFPHPIVGAIVRRRLHIGGPNERE